MGQFNFGSGGQDPRARVERVATGSWDCSLRCGPDPPQAGRSSNLRKKQTGARAGQRASCAGGDSQAESRLGAAQQRRSHGPGPAPGRGAASGGAWLPASRRHRWNEPGRVTSVRRGCPAMASLAGGPVATAFGSDSEVHPVREIWVSHLIRARPVLSLLSSGVVRSAYRCSHGKPGPFSTIRDSRPRKMSACKWMVNGARCAAGEVSPPHTPAFSEPSTGPAASWCAVGRLLATSASVRGPAQLMTRS